MCSHRIRWSHRSCCRQVLFHGAVWFLCLILVVTSLKSNVFLRVALKYHIVDMHTHTVHKSSPCPSHMTAERSSPHGTDHNKHRENRNTPTNQILLVHIENKWHSRANVSLLLRVCSRCLTRVQVVCFMQLHVWKGRTGCTWIYFLLCLMCFGLAEPADLHPAYMFSDLTCSSACNATPRESKSTGVKTMDDQALSTEKE